MFDLLRWNRGPLSARLSSHTAREAIHPSVAVAKNLTRSSFISAACLLSPVGRPHRMGHKAQAGAEWCPPHMSASRPDRGSKVRGPQPHSAPLPCLWLADRGRKQQTREDGEGCCRRRALILHPAAHDGPSCGGGGFCRKLRWALTLGGGGSQGVGGLRDQAVTALDPPCACRAYLDEERASALTIVLDCTAEPPERFEDGTAPGR